MSKNILANLNQVMRRLRTINLWHLVWIIILSEIVTAVMNTIMGIIWWGSISHDLIQIGTIDALVASIIVGPIVLYIIACSHETDSNYRELVENANSIILRMDTAGNITFFNEFAERFFGYSKDQIMGRSVVGTIVPEKESTGRDLAFMIMDLCTNPNKYSMNVNENMKKDGSRVWISWTNKPAFDQKGTIREILCIGSDITEIRNKDEKLRDYSRQLETLVSERTEELTSTVGRLQFEIAERNKTELALRESEIRFREIFEQDEDALFIIDPKLYKVIDINLAAISLFGYTRHEFLAEGLPLILKEPDHNHLRVTLLRMHPLETIQIDRIAAKSKDGATISAAVRCMTVQLKKNTLLFCSFRNITERVRMDEEAKMLQAKLIQMNKMTSLGMLVSGIAHEISNPNHFIAVNAKMVSDAWKDAANILSDHYREQGDFPLGGVPFSEMRYIMPQLLTAMSDGSERINNIVDNLKDFSKQGRAFLDKPVDINKIIAASAALMRNQIVKFTDCFQLREGIDLPLVKGSKQQLEQVIINLIMNALQSLRDRSARVIVSSCLERETNSVLIQVRDEGIGIPQEVLNHITEPFYTTRLEEGGSGLGLSISSAIIKDHQGSLTFLSEPGKGTIATISLPAYQSITERNRHATDLIS